MHVRVVSGYLDLVGGHVARLMRHDADPLTLDFGMTPDAAWRDGRVTVMGRPPAAYHVGPPCCLLVECLYLPDGRKAVETPHAAGAFPDEWPANPFTQTPRWNPANVAS